MRAAVVVGIGGSATAGDYLAALCEEDGRVPVHAVRGFSLPGYVDKATLAVLVSYSGNTEETIAAYDDARRRGAHMVVVTGGGRLAARAASDGVARCAIAYDSPPRAALGHGLATLLRIADRAGIRRTTAAEVEQAAAAHARYVECHLCPAVASGPNVAKQTAIALRGRVPLVFAAEHLAPAATRFRNQLAENGKTVAASYELPEAGHNLVEGLATIPGQGRFCALMLESPHYDLRTTRRLQATATLFEEAGVPVIHETVPGDRPLAEMVCATALGDYTSCYLAMLQGFDPAPIPNIERLKALSSE